MSNKRKSNFRKQTVSDAKRQKRQASSYGYLNLPKGVKIFNIKEKTREILMDIIPYKVTDSNHPDRDVDENRAIEDTLWYKRPFKIHRNIGADNGKFICLTSVRKKCPICEWVADQRRKGEDWDDIKDVAAKDRNLYAIRPIDSKDHDEVVHVWDMSWFLFQEELNDQLEEDPDNGDFPELEEGKTLLVKFRWKSRGKYSYPVTRDITFEDRAQQYNEDILDEVPNLDEVLNVLSYKELEAKFLDIEDEDEDATDEGDRVIDIDEDEESETAFRRRKKAEPEEEKTTEPEEEKDNKPKRTRRKRPDKSSSKDKCPHGLKFGKDCASDKICDECDLWDECDEEQEKQEK